MMAVTWVPSPNWNDGPGLESSPPAGELLSVPVVPPTFEEKVAVSNWPETTTPPASASWNYFIRCYSNVGSAISPRSCAWPPSFS